MASLPKANAVIGQSGGPTGVINASLVGVIEEVRKHPEIENIYGAIHAVDGMANDKFIDLGKLSSETLERVAASPSSALGSSREKPDEKKCAEILEVFKKRNRKKRRKHNNWLSRPILFRQRNSQDNSCTIHNITQRGKN